jgi:transcriptional regulator with XRE-family HTH domain
MFDFKFATSDEVCRELGARLKAQRLAQSTRQEELAQRAGVSVGTVKNLENKGQSSVESLVRVALALGLANQLDALFGLEIKSIVQMEAAERAVRRRAPRRASP